MSLISVYERPDHCRVLFNLLSERDDGVSISHCKMPSWDEHVAFVSSKPYEAWYIIHDDVHGNDVGACYLTKQNEIGVFIFKAHRGRGHGPFAVKELMRLHGNRRYLANMNPSNARSAELFKGLGFKLIQHTYEG